MDARDLVISYDTARLLADLKLPQSSVYYWVGVKNRELKQHANGLYEYVPAYNIVGDRYDEDEYALGMYSAYTATELGILLPAPFESGKSGSFYFARQVDGRSQRRCEVWGYTSEAEARAALFIALKSQRQPSNIQLVGEMRA